MNKKQLKQRILDVAAGAGLQWVDDAYWDGQCAESLGLFLSGLNTAFELNNDSFLTHFNSLHHYDELDELVDLFWSYRSELSGA